MNHRHTPSRHRALGCFLVALVPLASSTGAAAADQQPRLSPLALRNHCDECHAVAAARIGPPFVAVAARHRGEGASAVEPLVQKIIHGGAGNWGAVPMVPNERISVEDAHTLVRWILTLRSG
jgi:cytochrome c551/c552